MTLLKNLKELGNTLIIVEHDEDITLNSDYIIDIGPGAGVNGGNIVEVNNVEEFLKSKINNSKIFKKRISGFQKEKKEKNLMSL